MLNVGRGDAAHLSLGRGIHHSLGDALARLEGRIVLETLIEHLTRVAIRAEHPRFRISIVFRGLHSLPLRCVLR